MVLPTGQFIQQAFAGVFEQLDGKLEIAFVAVIRIRDGLLTRVVTEVVAHPDNLLAVGSRTGLARHVVIVLMIHHGNQVEAVEIGSRELTGTMVEDITMPLATATHTVVGQLSDMPGADTGGVNIEIIDETTPLDEMMHDAIGSRRAADIAQADKEKTLFHMFTVTSGFHKMVLPA